MRQKAKWAGLPHFIKQGCNRQTSKA